MTKNEIVVALNNGERLYNKKMYANLVLKVDKQITNDDPMFGAVFKNPGDWIIAPESDGMS